MKPYYVLIENSDLAGLYYFDYEDSAKELVRQALSIDPEARCSWGETECPEEL